MTEKEQSVEFQSKIVEFLSSKMQGIKDGALQNVERIAVGWSHETWLFDFAYLRNASPFQSQSCNSWKSELCNEINVHSVWYFNS